MAGTQPVVLVSGAASGIGRATALRLARDGARVAVTDRDGDGAAAVAREIAEAGGTARATPLDVRSEVDWQAAIAATHEAWDRLDVLIANAGIAAGGPVADTSLDDWRAVFEVNVDGVFLGVKHAVRAMRDAGGGRIVIVASASGVKASPGASAYCASKAAVLMFARAVALECAADGIRVNCVVPAGVMTPMWEGMPFFQDLVREHGSSDAAFAALAARDPMRRYATPDEVAAAIAFLASDDASFVTGAALAVDGGYTA